MAVLLVTDYGADVEAWRRELQRRDSGVDLRLWPNAGDKGAIDVLLTDIPLNGEGGYRQFPNLRWVAFLGHGVADIVKDPELPDGIQVTRLRDPFIIRGVSEYVVRAVTAQHLRIAEYREQQRQAVWARLDVTPASDIHVVVLGLGSIGSRAATLLRDLGFRVSGWSRSAKSIDGIQCHHGRDALSPLMRSADYLVCILPSTSETIGLINSNTLATMKRTAYLINVGRGSLVVEKDLIAVLDAGRLAGACLDVQATEPLPAGSPLWQHPRITLTPHTGGTGGAGEYMAEVADNYARFKSGGSLQGLADRERGY